MRKHFVMAIAAALLAATAIALTPAPALAADGYVCQGRVAYRDRGDHMEVWDYLDPGITGSSVTAQFVESKESDAKKFGYQIVDWNYGPSSYASAENGNCPWQVTTKRQDGSWWTFSYREQWKQVEPHALPTANTGTDIVIPSHVNGKPVTAIRTLAFGSLAFSPRYHYSVITSISLPDTITSLPENAFSVSRELTRVHLPDTLATIGPRAFANKPKIAEINVPARLKTVGEGAFDGCSQAVQAKFARWTTASGGTSGGTSGGSQSGTGATTYYQFMYRLYNPTSGEHFYTARSDERNRLVKLGWHDEGVGWRAPVSGAEVYRLYNANGGEHHYTLSRAERDQLVAAGWSYEGVGWHSGGSTPLYRQYNPNQFANNHNYTASRAERDNLLGLGWRDEGVAWYGL